MSKSLVFIDDFSKEEVMVAIREAKAKKKQALV